LGFRKLGTKERKKKKKEFVLRKEYAHHIEKRARGRK